MEWGGTYDDISLSLDAGAIDMLVFLGDWHTSFLGNISCGGGVEVDGLEDLVCS